MNTASSPFSATASFQRNERSKPLQAVATLDSAVVIASMSCFSLRSEVWIVLPLVAYMSWHIGRIGQCFERPTSVA